MVNIIADKHQYDRNCVSTLMLPFSQSHCSAEWLHFRLLCMMSEHHLIYSDTEQNTTYPHICETETR